MSTNHTAAKAMAYGLAFNDSGEPTPFVLPTFPSDELLDGGADRALNLAKADAVESVTAKLPSRTVKGLAINSLVIQYRVGLFPDLSLEQLGEAYGFPKASLYAADARLFPGIPLAAITRRSAEQRARMAESQKRDHWRRRRKCESRPGDEAASEDSTNSTATTEGSLQ